jgi:hypothetical protein
MDQVIERLKMDFSESVSGFRVERDLNLPQHPYVPPRLKSASIASRAKKLDDLFKGLCVEKRAELNAKKVEEEEEEEVEESESEEEAEEDDEQ